MTYTKSELILFREWLNMIDGSSSYERRCYIADCSIMIETRRAQLAEIIHQAATAEITQ
jgi:phosphotransacetylase